MNYDITFLIRNGYSMDGNIDDLSSCLVCVQALLHFGLTVNVGDCSRNIFLILLSRASLFEGTLHVISVS